MSVLQRYIVFNFLKSFAIVFLCLFSILSILESMEVVRRYFSAGYNPSLIQIIKVTFCRATTSICSFYAFIVLITSVVFYTTMHGRLEISVIRGAGISPFQITKMVLFAVSILGFIYITAFEWLSVYSYRNFKETNASLKYSSTTEGDLTITNKGIWFRDTYERRAYIISARNFNQKESSLQNLRFFEFGKDENLKSTIYARDATIAGGHWILTNCKIVRTTGEEYTQKMYKLPTKLSLRKIDKMVSNPNTISFWSIKKYIEMLDKVGLSSLKYRLHLYSKIATILQMVAFAVAATAFCMGYNHRDRRTYMGKVATLVFSAFPAHFINNIIMAYGESGALPLSIAAFAVPILFLLFGTITLCET